MGKSLCAMVPHAPPAGGGVAPSGVDGGGAPGHLWALGQDPDVCSSSLVFDGVFSTQTVVNCCFV